jgi:cytoskeletal protein RodZ
VPETVTENRAGQPVGAFLREIRESRGLTLEDAAAVTRIGKNYLLAIEEGTYEKLPSSAYVKGFLRVYAGYLGLSGDEIIARFEPAVASRSGMAHEQAGSPTTSPREKRTRRKSGDRARWLASTILLLLVIAAAYLFEEKTERPNPPAPPQSVPLATAPVAAIQPPRTSTTSAVSPAAVVTPQAESPPASVESPSRGIILRLKVSQDSSLNITIDDFSQQYDLKAGDLIEWKADRQFILDLGNAGGVEAELNGRTLKPLGEKGQPAHVVLKAGSSEG